MPSPYLVSYNITDHDFSPPQSFDGYGYKIADNFILTAGHVFFEWNRSQSNPVIIQFGTIGLDYREYRAGYLAEITNRITNGGPFPDNDLIEASIGASKDTLIITRNNSQVNSGDRGIVLFLDPNDMKPAELSTALGSNARISRAAHHTSPTGEVVGVFSAGWMTFSAPSIEGDSGGVYLLRHDSHRFIIGTHNANTSSGADAVGTYFTPTEWVSLHNLFEVAQAGNVTSSEPTNLVVGTTTGDVVTGSYRSDIILGRGGSDSINDGDFQGDSVWADDTLVGDDGEDLFFAPTSTPTHSMRSSGSF